MGDVYSFIVFPQIRAAAVQGPRGRRAHEFQRRRIDAYLVVSNNLKTKRIEDRQNILHSLGFKPADRTFRCAERCGQCNLASRFAHRAQDARVRLA